VTEERTGLASQLIVEWLNNLCMGQADYNGNATTNLMSLI
jgi:hypothetical protein